MSNLPERPNTVLDSNSGEGQTDTAQLGGNPEPENNREWRFDIDFRLNPNWLTNPDAGGGIPLPLSMLNDWIRNIQRPLSSESQRSSTTSSTSSSSLPYDTMRNNNSNTSSGPLSANMGGPRQIPSIDSHTHSSLPGSNSRRGTSTSSATEQDVEYHPLSSPPSIRRNSRPTVIDLAENSNEWDSNQPLADPVDPHDETLSDPPERVPSEATAFLAVAERYVPFILILLIKGILDHICGLTVFFGLVVTFGHVNTLLRREVTKQGKRSLPMLVMVIMNLTICVLSIYYIFQADKLYPALLCMPTEVDVSSVQSLLWVVLVTDFIAKFLTVMMKSFVILLPERVIPFQKRGKYYMFLESSSQLYRCFLPIHPWILYLFDAFDGSLKIFGVLLCMLYVICKAVDVTQRIVAWRIALRKFLQPVHYGTVPTEEELNELFCPICHDGFTCPTKLKCGHIFCEDCVSTWLDRGERSCPMCRARVVDDTSWRDGTTSQFIQTF